MGAGVGRAGHNVTVIPIEQDRLLYHAVGQGPFFNDAGSGFLHLAVVSCPGRGLVDKGRLEFSGSGTLGTACAPRRGRFRSHRSRLSVRCSATPVRPGVRALRRRNPWADRDTSSSDRAKKPDPHRRSARRSPPRMKETPGGLEFASPLAQQMVQLGQYRRRGCERQAQLRERLRAGLMPLIVLVEKRQDRSGVYEPASLHAGSSGGCGGFPERAQNATDPAREACPAIETRIGEADAVPRRPQGCRWPSSASLPPTPPATARCSCLVRGPPARAPSSSRLKRASCRSRPSSCTTV